MTSVSTPPCSFGSSPAAIPTARDADHVDELIRRLACGERSNALDVLVEVALFEADDSYVAARANNAGTKVIYTQHDGMASTHWAPDWSLRPEKAAELLRDHLAATPSTFTAGHAGRQPEVTPSKEPIHE